MLPSLNGNENNEPSYPFALDEISQVGEARRFGLVLSSYLDFSETQKGRVAIVINELGTNLVKYGKDSKIVFRIFSDHSGSGLEIISIDRGPGLDETLAMVDGYTTGDSPGTGLGAVRRQSDAFDIYSTKEKGTVIISRILSSNANQINEKNNFEIGAINIPFPGEVVSGDAWCVRKTDLGLTAIMVDGLGHGPQAHAAAVEALNVFQTTSQAPVGELLQSIHSQLQRTRGAAVFLLATKPDSVSFVGAGNIRAVIQTEEKMKTLITQNGTAGLQLGRIKPLEESWDQKGYLILHSDGILGRWNLSNYPGILNRHPSVLAAVIYRDFERGHDDATVIVIRQTP